MMPGSDLAFVGKAREPDDALPVLKQHSSNIRRANMRILRNLGFALASLAIVAAIGITVEYQPVINALAR
jgi:hypothetical protein